MAIDQRLRQAEFQAEAAHLVLEQILERLDQLEAEFLGQSADVVVRLDVGGRSVHGAAALDHVGIQRALREKVSVVDVAGLVLEHVDEDVADAAAFLLRIADALQRLEETRRRHRRCADRPGSGR